MASLKDAERLADELEKLVGELRSEFKDSGDFDRLVEIASLEGVLLALPCTRGFLGPGVARQAAPDQDERVDDGRPRQRDLERDASPDGRSHERSALDLQLVEQREEITRMRVGAGRKRRAAVPAQVVPDRPVCPREGLPLRAPHPAVADPRVDEDDIRAVPRDLRVQIQTGEAQAETSSPRFARTPSSSSLNESANFSTPSRSRTATTSS